METTYEDISLTCKDCGAEFIFTAGEQQFYAEKGFTNQPVRCAACRKARKQQKITIIKILSTIDKRSSKPLIQYKIDLEAFYKIVINL